MAHYPETQIRSSTHHLTPFTANDGSEVQPMQVSCVMLRGKLRSCGPNLGGKVTRTPSAQTHSCARTNKCAEGKRSLLTSSSPSEAFHTCSTAARVNGARSARFTLSFTDPFTLKPSISQREQIDCAEHEDGFGRGQNTGLRWSDPTFGQVHVAKRPPGSLQPSTLVA
jgi:hypothetical protein